MSQGSAAARLVLATVGPPSDRPCGILDYRRRLDAELSSRCDLIPLSYAEALDGDAAKRSAALLVHYERSLVPSSSYMESLARRHPGKVFALPHEVYREDPFAFPYASLRASSAPLLWMKRLRYRWLHRAYAREQALQAAAYHAHRVVPLSSEGAQILRERARGAAEAARLLAPVPIARFDLPDPEDGSPGSAPEPLFASRPAAVMGIFGFLNPGLDYGVALDVLESIGEGLGLALLGGDRAGPPLRPGIESAAQVRRISNRVRIAGWIPEARVKARLRECDFFLCPMRVKSNSASLLQLFGQGKPILVPDLPLTRYLRDEGAPLDLYADGEEMTKKVREIIAGRRRAPPDLYPWSMAKVAEAYLAAVAGAGPGPQ